MIAYIDSSVLLRIVLNQSDRLASWERIDEGAVSALIEVECMRTLDRVRLRERISDQELASRIDHLRTLLASLSVIEVTRPILSRAAQPFATALGTLGAIHLSSALLWRDQIGCDVILATHDVALARAAQASGLGVAS